MARHPDDKHRQELYRGMPSVTNRSWGTPKQDDGFGYPGQGGYGESRPELKSRGDAGRTGGHRGRGPRNILRSDERIADDLIERLTRDEEIDASEILVAVEAGSVTLTGEVPERRMKHLAENLAAEVQGRDGDVAARARLIQRAGVESEPDVREAIDAALAAIQRRSGGAHGP